MSTTTIVLIIAAVVVMAAVAFFGRPNWRKQPVPVAAAENDDPALSATGEAMIVGDVIPLNADGSHAPQAQQAKSATPQPLNSQPTARPDARPAQRKPDPRQIYEAPRPSDSAPKIAEAIVRDVEPPPRPAEPVGGSASAVDIRWTKRFAPREGALDDATRLTLLRDLGIVRAPWGVPLLTQAYEEEPTPEHRRAALRALAAYRHPDAQPTFESALRADDEESRAIAATALGALKIRAALPS